MATTPAASARRATKAIKLVKKEFPNSKVARNMTTTAPNVMSSVHRKVNTVTKNPVSRTQPSWGRAQARRP